MHSDEERGQGPGQNEWQILLSSEHLVSAAGSEGSLRKADFHRAHQDLRCSYHWENLTPTEGKEEEKEVSVLQWSVVLTSYTPRLVLTLDIKNSLCNSSRPKNLRLGSSPCCEPSANQDSHFWCS